MKISADYGNLSFKALNQSSTVPQRNKKCEVTAAPKKSVPVEVLKAYNSVSPKKGILNSNVTPDYDESQLVYVLKSPYNNADKVKFIYSIDSDKDKREAFSSPKNVETGEFTVNIPVLNRVNNSIYPSLKIDAVEYFNDMNEKIGEETPENLVIEPESILQVKESRSSVVDGDFAISELDAISEGVSVGKLVKMKYEDVIRYKGTEPIISILSEDDMEDMFTKIAEGSFSLPMNVEGLIMSPPRYKQGHTYADVLGHTVSRLRGRKIFALLDSQTLNKIEKAYYENSDTPFVKIKLDSNKIEVSGEKTLPKVDRTPIKLPKNKFVNSILLPEDKDFTPEAVGLKAYNLGRLKKLQRPDLFKVPNFYVVPAGIFNEVKKSPENTGIYGKNTDDITKIGDYHFHVNKADNSENPSDELPIIRDLIIERIFIPKEIREELKEKTALVFGNEVLGKQGRCLIARSSFNGEDSDEMATQGLYDSFAGVRTHENLFKAIKEVWASKWSDLAYMSRRNHKIPHSAIQANVIVQEMSPVDYTFTINTADPRTNNPNKMVIQLSKGVYSGMPNSPYVFEYDKTSGEIERKKLAAKKRAKDIPTTVMDDVLNNYRIQADYSHDPLNLSKRHYAPIMKKIFEVASYIESEFGGKPQDIEGGIIFNQNEETGELEPQINIWQTRDVHMRKR